MKTGFILSLIIIFSSCVAQPSGKGLQEGDILFQGSGSPQSDAIELATHSHFSHVGILLNKDGRLMVFEAVQPVKYTQLDEWVARGKSHQYVVMRLKDAAALDYTVLGKIHSLADKYTGKDYDYYFNWDDKEMYCSELVWKLYDKAGIRLCKLKKFANYDFTDPIVQAEVKKRYGNNVPMKEPIIAPDDLYHSHLLKEIK